MPHADEEEKRAAVLEALKQAEGACAAGRAVVAIMKPSIVRTKLSARIIDAVRQLEAAQRVINHATRFEGKAN